jgi:hypothetical protein
MNESKLALSKVHTCDFCGTRSQWTLNTPDSGMFCLRCHCGFCVGLMAFRTSEDGKLDAYCPACESQGLGPTAVVN